MGCSLCQLSFDNLQASPSTPPTTPVLPLVRVAEGVPIACRVPCPPLAAGARRRGAGLVSFFRWIADVARRLGVVASRRGAGDERGKPLYTPYDPYTPCLRGGGRPCRMLCTLSAARRWGRSARIFPCFARVICAPAAALPRCGDRLRAPACWWAGCFPVCTLSGGE